MSAGVRVAVVELLARVPRPVRIVAQEVAVVGSALACVLLSDSPGLPFSRPAAVVACLALPLRLRWPWLSMLFCLAGLSGELGLAPALAGLYRIGRTSGSSAGTAAWVTAAILALEATVFATSPMSPAGATLSVLFTALWMIAPAALGMLLTTRARLAASLAALRVARESELDAHAQRARAQERTRIAQEIHDAVGHHATLIAVEAAALAATSDDQRTVDAAGRMRELAKASLAEMRVALGLAEGGAERGSLDDLPALVARARAAGLAVELDATVVRDADLNPVVARAAFRIVQECLTNAAKYAADGLARVRVALDGADLVVVVESGPPLTDGGFAEGGSGLTGMAERAGAVGGELTVAREAGTFTVRARLPLHGYAPSKVGGLGPTKDGTQSTLGVR